MKHKLTFFAVLMMALAIPQSVKAYDFEYTYQGQTLYYNIVDGNAQVTYQNNYPPSYSNLTGDLVIPDSVTYNGNTYAVTSIGDYTFRGCSGLTSVTIPDAVTSIGLYAFYGCRGLTSVTIG
ncbi:MAG: leucine-rich repeat domain-containing protein, partial [Bacteroidales bacterium]|nr:leucine-rich repeat domain-containing protein [Bacteroidales bacterium]